MQPAASYNQLRRPPISCASPLQRPTFSRSSPLAPAPETSIFTLKPLQSPTFFTSPWHIPTKMWVECPPPPPSPELRKNIFTKLSGTWPSRGSYGCYIVVTGSVLLLRYQRLSLFRKTRLAWLIRDSFPWRSDRDISDGWYALYSNALFIDVTWFYTERPPPPPSTPERLKFHCEPKSGLGVCVTSQFPQRICSLPSKNLAHHCIIHIALTNNTKLFIHQVLKKKT